MNSDSYSHTYSYAPYYCEENIWQLCQNDDFRDFDRKVVFISNENRTCALWNQRASSSPGEPVLWDYHVILLVKADGWQVYDLDTVLGAPLSVEQYIDSTFGDESVPEEFQPQFRVIDANDFAANFSSDRSHMLTSGGQWQVPPPPWPAIVREGGSNLMEFVDMQKPTFGIVMKLPEFTSFFV